MKFYLFVELVGCISLKYLCNFQCIYFIMTCRQNTLNISTTHSNDRPRTNDISMVTIIKERSPNIMECQGTGKNYHSL